MSVISFTGPANADSDCESIALKNAIQDLCDMIALGACAAGNGEQRLATYALQEADEKAMALLQKIQGED